jgi:hypothetical protein
MPSPFPGMNPYLERSAVWHDFHEAFIPALREQLVPQIRPNYIAKVYEEVYIHELSAEQRRPLGRPDVAIAELGEGVVTVAGPRVAAPATGVLTEPALDIERLAFIEIRERESNRLITAIELLSPANKIRGQDRGQYLGKRAWLIKGCVNLVEIDLLRGHPRMPIEQAAKSDFLVLVSRALDQPQADLWPFSLRNPIPDIPVPLKPGEREPMLDLQAALHRVYDAAGYEDYIYDGEPEPPLTPEQAEWAKAFVPRRAT